MLFGNTRSRDFAGYLDKQMKVLSDCSDTEKLDALRAIGPMYKDMYAKEKAIADIRTHGKRYLAMIDILDESSASGEISALEIGCNTGFLSMFFGQKYPKANVVAVDMAEKQIRVNKIVGDIYNSTVKFETLSGQDVTSMYGNGQFDIVFLCEILEHIEYMSDTQKAVLKQSLDVLTDTGVCIVTVPFEDRIPAPGHLTEFNKSMIEELLATASTHFADLDWVRKEYALEKHFCYAIARSAQGLSWIRPQA